MFLNQKACGSIKELKESLDLYFSAVLNMTLSLLFIFLFLNSEGSAGKPLQRRGLCTGEICKHVSSFWNFIFLTVSEKARSGDTCGIGPVQVQIRYWRRWKNITVYTQKKKRKKRKRQGKKERVSTFLNRPGLVLGRMTQA